MIFLELTVDAFTDSLKSFKSDTSQRGAGVESARRPLRGLEIKNDTYANLRVMTAQGHEIEIINSSYPSGRGGIDTNFILQSVQEQRVEKSQIVETFGEDYIYFFGERPRSLSCNALLLNSFDFNWKAEFLANYEKYFRGTKLVELGARAYLFYDDNIVEGMMTNCVVVDQSMQPMQVSLQFELFVMKANNISFVGDPKYPVRPDYRNPNEAVTVSGLIPGKNAREVPSWIGDKTATAPANRTSLDNLNAVTDKALSRSNIADNVDEWTGDFFANKKRQRTKEEIDRDFDALVSAYKDVQELCKKGLNLGNPSSMRNMGMMGPGGDSDGLKAAWKAAKNGSVKGIVSGLGQAGILNVRGSSSIAVSTPFGNAGAGAGFGVDRQGTGSWSSSYSGSGAAYYGGQGVGYQAGAGAFNNSNGGQGYYAGAGVYGSSQQGAPAMGAGSRVAGTFAGAGAYAGWTPGTGWRGQTQSGQVPAPPGFGAYAGAGSGYGSAGIPSGGFQQGAYLGSYGYSTPGYQSNQYSAGYGVPQTASSRYYAQAGASYDPQNGFQWGSSSGSTSPPPGQPGGGIFTTQAYAGATLGGVTQPLIGSGQPNQQNKNSCSQQGDAT